MNTDYSKEEVIFDRARQLASPDAVAKYLEQACGDNQQLKERILNLIDLERQEGMFDRPPLGLSSTDVQLTDITRQTIGPYRIREKIGEGGMGVVYVADQTEPLQRRVALKVIKPGMDTAEVIARFEAERQALAFMDHPNIARVMDAGATETGRSYFVMELVRGIPITEYCDRLKMHPRRRLELFITVCEAVQHAHQKGIIHRDIKPSNVLVTQAGGKPVVKVIDFGLAKAVSGQSLTDKTVYTGFMRLMGTPVYMSPEQAGLSSQDIDTRSDVYSLGVLLYELLTGTTPLENTDIGKQSYDDLCRSIRETEAPKPSARISTLNNEQRSTIGLLRQVEPDRLRKLLGGDLDRVTMKAIEKDRDRRYGGPKGLAADIQRFLDDKPVLAMPPSAWYLARKFTRRHKTAILAAVVAFSFLVLAVAASWWQVMQLAKVNAKAKADRDAFRRMHYAASMQFADQLWEDPNGVPSVIHDSLLEWIPADGQYDLRDWVWRHQWTRLHEGADRTVPGTQDATFSASGRLVVADKGGVRAWDKSSLQFEQFLEPEQIANTDRIVQSPCGRWAALVTSSGPPNKTSSEVRVVELSTGEVIYDVVANQVQFSCNGESVLTWRQRKDHAIQHQLWHIASKIPIELDANVADHLATTEVESMSFNDTTFLFADGFNVRVLPGPFFRRYEKTTTATALGPDGRIFVSGHSNGDVILRLTQSPDLSLEFKVHGGSVCSLALSPDSSRIATGTMDGRIEIWDVSQAFDQLSRRLADSAVDDRISTNATFIQSLKGHLARISTIAFSPDGSRLISRSTDGVTKLWSLQQAPLLNHVTTRSQDLYSGATGVHLKQADAQDREEGRIGVLVKELVPEHHVVVSGEINKGDRIIGVTNQDGYHEIDSTWEYHDVVPLLRGPHRSTVKVHVESDDQSKRVVELRRQLQLSPHVLGLSYSPSGTSIAVADYRHGTVSLTIDGKPKRRYPVRGTCVKFSPDGKYLAMDDHRHVVLWDVRKDEPYARLDARLSAPASKYSGHWGTIAFSPDSKFIAVGTGIRVNAFVDSSDLRVWDVATQQEVTKGPLMHIGRVISGVAFSPDGKWLLAVSHGRVLRFWNTDTWKLERELSTVRTASLCISPDGKTIAIGGIGVQLLDFDSGKVLHNFPRLGGFGLTFSDDGSTLVATGLEREVALINVSNGRQLSSLSGHQDEICGCDFSPDGNTLATIDVGGNLRLWEAKALDEIDVTIERLQKSDEAE